VDSFVQALTADDISNAESLDKWLHDIEDPVNLGSWFFHPVISAVSIFVCLMRSGTRGLDAIRKSQVASCCSDSIVTIFNCYNWTSLPERMHELLFVLLHCLVELASYSKDDYDIVTQNSELRSVCTQMGYAKVDLTATFKLPQNVRKLPSQFALSEQCTHGGIKRTQTLALLLSVEAFQQDISNKMITEWNPNHDWKMIKAHLKRSNRYQCYDSMLGATSPIRFPFRSKLPNRCLGCGRLELQKRFQTCLSCRLARFCSADCMRLNWEQHKQDCRLKRSPWNDFEECVRQHDKSKSPSTSPEPQALG